MISHSLKSVARRVRHGKQVVSTVSFTTETMRQILALVKHYDAKDPDLYWGVSQVVRLAVREQWRALGPKVAGAEIE